MQLNSNVAYVGQRLKSTPEDVRSMPMAGAGVVNDGDAVVDFGDGVRCGAVEGSKRIIGIVVLQHIGKNGRDAQGNEVYQQYDTVPVMRSGRIWVKVTDKVSTTGGKVYVRTSSPDEQHPLGSIQTTSENATELVGASFDSISNADGLAIITLKGV